MRIHKFEGATMRDAIAKVKAELGDQAVIISTRQVRRGLLGSAVEISAAIDDDDDRAPVPPTPAFAQRAETARPEPQPRGEDPEKALEKIIAPLRSEMRSLRALVRASDSHARTTSELRGEVEQLKKLLGELRTTPTPTPPNEPTHGAAIVRASTGRIVMLVGPTGAGKTTTIAKIAANAALVDEKRVLLVTLDNYRVGGVEQIRTFADLIGVPLQVAESPADLAQILSAKYDLTLIDTAGRSPRDVASIGELAAELPQLPAIEVHVAVPAAASAAAIDELVGRYRALSPARLLFTKLDEVESAPELLAAPARTRLPVAWVTTGQAVPEDIEQPSRARLHELATSGTTSNNHRAA